MTREELVSILKEAQPGELVYVLSPDMIGALIKYALDNAPQPALERLSTKLAEAIRNRDRFEVMLGSVNDDLSKAEAELAALKAQPASEPVACVADFNAQVREQFLKDGYLLSDGVYATPQPAQSEPVAWKLQFLTDVSTAAGLLSHGKTDKGLARRISDGAYRWREELFFAQQPAQREPKSLRDMTEADFDEAHGCKPAQSEPVAYVLTTTSGKRYLEWAGSIDTRDLNVASPLYATPQPAQSEPVARFNWNIGGFEWLTEYDYWKHHMKPLYLAPQPSADGWLRAFDEAMVSSHLGIADASDSYEVAKRKLNDLICWNVQVDRDLNPERQPSAEVKRQLPKDELREDCGEVFQSDGSTPEEMLRDFAAPFVTAASAEVAVCVWHCLDDDTMPDTWEGSCGSLWTFTEGGPVDNDMNFCPKCGGNVEAMNGEKE